jgi:hypothetical protein
MSGRATAELDGVALAGSAGHGACVEGGRFRAKDSIFRGHQGAAVHMTETSAVDLTRCLLDGNRYGLGAAGGNSRLTRVELRPSCRAAVPLASGCHRLRRASFSGYAAAPRVASDEARRPAHEGVWRFATERKNDCDRDGHGHGEERDLERDWNAAEEKRKEVPNRLRRGHALPARPSALRATRAQC